MSDAPATITPDRDTLVLDDRVQRINQETLIFKALRSCQPGNRRGNISKCWKLDAHTRFVCAVMHIVEFKSAQEIIDSLGDRMGVVDVRSLSGWLKTLRKAYARVHDSQLEEMEHAEALMYQSGDLVAVAALTFGALAPKFIALGNAIDSDTDPKYLNVFLRFLESATAAAKVQAEAKLAEARTNKVLTDVRKILVQGTGKKQSKSKSMTKEEVLATAIAAVDEVMGTGARP